MTVFDRIFGLPAHPLIIHAAVVVTPLLAVLAIGYVALPRLRHKLDWAAVLAALAAPVCVFAARESGEAFAERLFQGRPPAAVLRHEGFAAPLLLSTTALAVAVLALVLLTRARRDPGAGTTTVARAGVLVAGVACVVLALLVGYYVVRIGHTGATAVWGGGR